MATADRVEEGAPSIEELRQRVRENPGELGPLRTLGWELYGLKRYDEARDTLQEATENFPQDPEVFYALGLAQRQLGDKGAARQSFKRAIEIAEAEDRTPRIDMLHRLASGHVNQLEHGTWGAPRI